MLYTQSPKMDPLLHNIYMGNLIDSQDHNELVDKGITAVLSLTPSGTTPRFHDIVYTKVSLDDGPYNIDNSYRTAVDLLYYLTKSGHIVLLHCQQGVSRTPAIAIMYLVKYGKLKLEEAKTIVFRIRPICQNMLPLHLTRIKEIFEQDNVAF